MTAQKLHDYFNILLDKFGSPYFLEEEVDMFLNSAQNKLIQEYFPDNEDYLFNVELNQHTTRAMGSLYDTSVISSIPISNIEYIDINSTTGVYKILAVYTESNLPIDFKRQNDIAKSYQNVFLEPSVSNPIFKFTGTGIKIYPELEENILIEYLKEPIDIDLSSSQGSQLASFLHFDLVSEAINLSGVATRDQAMVQLNNV